MAVKPHTQDNTISVDFNPELFNNVYWHLRRAFRNVLIRFIWLYGGSSASKTYSVVQLIIVSMMEHQNENTMILRKYAVDIKDSIYSDFKKIIGDWELTEYFIIQQNYICCTLTGSYVRFRGLDDAEKIKGLANFKRVVLEEVSQFEHEDLKQIRKRLRGAANQQIIGIFNPISEEHWIKVDIFDEEILTEVELSADEKIAEMQVNDKGNMVVMKTNYLDNIYIVGKWPVNNKGELVQTGGFVDQHTIDDFEKDKIKDFQYYRVYGLGDWGKLRTGGEFWKKFNANLHMVNVKWNEDYPLHIAWDENVNPYITELVWQVYSPDTLSKIGSIAKVQQEIGVQWDGKSYVAIQIDEICLPDPRNRVKDACMEFQARYPVDRVAGLKVYGDRTSIKEDTKLEKGENFFTIILGHLRDYHPDLRMQGTNPSVAQSGGFINESYAGNTGIQIFINSKCKKSLYDYQYALEDSDGTLKKTKKTHPVTKVQYEEFGHPSDAKRYLLTVAFGAQYEKYLRGGKKTLPLTGKSSSKNNF